MPNQWTGITELDRFYRNLILPEDYHNCWLWEGSHDAKGYPIFKINKKTSKVSRWAYKYFIGNIPDELFVCHKCDNPGCINPLHLELGTFSKNMQDRLQRGRNPNVKLSENEVIEIRKLFDTGEYTKSSLSKIFDISPTQIRYIVNRLAWKHLNGKD